MKKVLVLTPWFPNHPKGWPGKFVSDSATAIAKNGNRVGVEVFRGWVPRLFGKCGAISREHKGTIASAEFLGLEFLRVNRYVHIPRGLLPGLTRSALERSIRSSTIRCIEDFDPDIILIHTQTISSPAVQLAHKYNIPALVVLHGQTSKPLHPSNELQAAGMVRALATCDRLLVVGEPIREYAERLCGRKDHVRVLWNGVSLQEAVQNHRVVAEGHEKPLRLIAVANLNEGKGLDILIEALIQLESEGYFSWQLTLIGDGPQKSMLLSLAASAGIDSKINFLGAQQNDMVLQELVQHDVFVLPSYREAFGIVYAEAMAARLLVIGVEEQGPSQFIVDGETGFLVAPKSRDSIAERLRWIMAGPRERWQKIADKGYDFACANLSWEAYANRFSIMMTEVLTERKSKSNDRLNFG